MWPARVDVIMSMLEARDQSRRCSIGFGLTPLVTVGWSKSTWVQRDEAATASGQCHWTSGLHILCSASDNDSPCIVFAQATDRVQYTNVSFSKQSRSRAHISFQNEFGASVVGL